VDIDNLAAEYEKKDDDELTEVVVSNYDLTEAIISAHPAMAQDAGFELFNREWAKRYWKTLVADVSGLKGAEKVQNWAISATISGTAAAIVATFGVPAIGVSAAVALAVILLRAARAERVDKT
jgi:hypothetical protein